MNRLRLLIIKKFRILTTLIGVLLACYGLAAMADTADSHYQKTANEQSLWVPVTNAQLDSLRGGFILPNGITVDISIERLIFTNGVKTFNSLFKTPDNHLLVKGDQLNLYSTIGNSLLSSVIQNNLDNQTIRALNTINIEIRNLKNITLNLSSRELYSQYILPNRYQ